MKAPKILLALLVLLLIFILSSCSSNGHINCAQKAKQLRKAHEKHVSQFAHYLKK